MVEMYRDQANHRWAFPGGNNRILADSGESYYNRADCEHAINLLKQLVPTARVISTLTGLPDRASTAAGDSLRMALISPRSECLHSNTRDKRVGV